jgi:hypothetical protein
MEPRESTFFGFGFGIARLGTTAFRMMLGQKPSGFALYALDALLADRSSPVATHDSLAIRLNTNPATRRCLKYHNTRLSFPPEVPDSSVFAWRMDPESA